MAGECLEVEKQGIPIKIKIKCNSAAVCVGVLKCILGRNLCTIRCVGILFLTDFKKVEAM